MKQNSTPQYFLPPVGMFFSALALVSVIFFASCSLPQRVVPPGEDVLSGTEFYSISFNGVIRRYGIHIPSGLTEQSPALVIVLHGRGGDESSMVRLSEGRFNLYAERYGYIALYPSALGGHWEDGRSDQLFARDGKLREDMDYIAFLVKEMQTLYSVDPNRVYVAGFSNGGMLALRLACEMPLPIRGVAAVAASLPVELESRCTVRPGLSPLPEAPVRLLLIHGTQDPVVPFQGGPIHGGEKVPRGQVLSVATTMGLFARRNGCNSHSTDDSETNWKSRRFAGRRTPIVRHSYQGCSANGRTEELDVLGGGHTWPGSHYNSPENQVGRTPLNFHGSDVILKFFFD